MVTIYPVIVALYFAGSNPVLTTKNKKVMETINITTEELKKLVDTAIQFGVDSPELVPNQNEREKIANWRVENTIKDIKGQR